VKHNNLSSSGRESELTEQNGFPTFRKVSTSVGSGKTHAAHRWLSEPHNARQNVVIVVPTVALANEQYRRLSEMLRAVESSRYVQTYHYGTCTGQVADTVRQEMSTLPTGYGATLIVTTATFLTVAGRISETAKRTWRVVFDEAFTPWVWQTFEFGTDEETRARTQQCFYTNLSREVASDRGRQHEVLRPAQGRQAQLQAVARGDKETGGWLQVAGMQNLASEVQNPVTRTEVVNERDSHIDIASVVVPQAFAAFADVVVMAALLEEHPLHALWAAEGVHWQKEHPISSYIERDMHTAQGPYVQIGHVLHPEDSASRRKAQLDATTGRPSETGSQTPVENQVLTRAIRELDAYFPKVVPKKDGHHSDTMPDKSWVLQLNKAMDVSATPGAVPERALTVSADVRGQDWMGNFQALAALAVVNPSPAQERWLQTVLNMDGESVRQMVRFHYVYQAFGRLVRDPACEHAKTVVTFGRADAEKLHRLLPGSTFLGQVTTLPKYDNGSRGAQKAPRLSDHPEYQATRNLSTSYGHFRCQLM